MTYEAKRKALLRLAIIALLGALYFSWLFYRSATASTIMLVRLWHDQDASSTVSADDVPASGVTVEVTEQCNGSVCAASTDAYTVVTDANGYASLELQPNTDYSISAPCLTMTVQAADGNAQAVQEWSTCGVWRLWLPVIAL